VGGVTVDPGWQVAVALTLLLALALGAHRVAGYDLARTSFVAAARAVIQLTVVALLIKAVVGNLALSALFSVATS
jgi:putative ABC transport system permease protein